MRRLVALSVVVAAAFGLSGRGIAFQDGSEPTVTAGLTASWKAPPLPEGLGDAVIDETCLLPPEFPADRRGKFRGSLFGQPGL